MNDACILRRKATADFRNEPIAAGGHGRAGVGDGGAAAGGGGSEGSGGGGGIASGLPIRTRLRKASCGTPDPTVLRTKALICLLRDTSDQLV